jgi:hypothetical protein
MRTFVNPVHLVTTKDGNCPNGYVEVGIYSEVARLLAFALKGLYEDQVDYLTLNKLGGIDNHWMRAARIALADYDKAISWTPCSAPQRRMDCRTIAGRGVCDMCAQGDYEKCRYTSDAVVAK